MKSFGRAVAAFLVMIVIGYLGVVALLPAPDGTVVSGPGVIAGPSAATRLSEEARGLVARRPDPSVIQSLVPSNREAL